MSVCLSVCLSVGYNRGAHKKAEPIEVQSGSLTRVSQTLRHYVCHRRSMFGRRAFSVADPSELVIRLPARSVTFLRQF